MPESNALDCLQNCGGAVGERFLTPSGEYNYRLRGESRKLQLIKAGVKLVQNPLVLVVGKEVLGKMEAEEKRLGTA